MSPTPASLRTSRARLPLGRVHLAGVGTGTSAPTAIPTATCDVDPSEVSGASPADPAHASSAAPFADAVAVAVAPISSEGSGPQDSAREFAALYQTWFRKVQRWIRALGGPAIDADDLTQEVFLVAHRKLDRFDGANIGGWLYRIAQLTVSDHRQRTWFKKVVLRTRDLTLDEYMSLATRQDEQLDNKKRERSYYQLVMQLNSRWRDSFMLFEVAGLSGQEIATLQGIPAATVRTHLSRARKELAELAAKQGAQLAA